MWQAYSCSVIGIISHHPAAWPLTWLGDLDSEPAPPPAPLCSQVPDPWLSDLLVGRATRMLNHFLKHLVGPERRELAVREPERFDFNARSAGESSLPLPPCHFLEH